MISEDGFRRPTSCCYEMKTEDGVRRLCSRCYRMESEDCVMRWNSCCYQWEQRTGSIDWTHAVMKWNRRTASVDRVHAVIERNQTMSVLRSSHIVGVASEFSANLLIILNKPINKQFFFFCAWRAWPDQQMDLVYSILRPSILGVMNLLKTCECI